MNNRHAKVSVKSVSNLMSQLTTGYGKKKCKPGKARNDNDRCAKRKSKSGSRTGSNLASKAMKLKHKEGISLKEAWKRVRFGYNPPSLVDYEWNPKTKRYNKKCGTGKVRNPATGRCVSDGTSKKGITPREPKQIRGYKVEIVIKPQGVDERIDLTGKNRAHNLKKLVEYYSRPELLPGLKYIYDIVNPKVTKRIVGEEGRIVFKYDHLDTDENEIDVGIDMALSLDDNGNFPVTTNGAGRIVDIRPNSLDPNVTLLSEGRGAVKKIKPFY